MFINFQMNVHKLNSDTRFDRWRYMNGRNMVKGCCEIYCFNLGSMNAEMQCNVKIKLCDIDSVLSSLFCSKWALSWIIYSLNILWSKYSCSIVLLVSCGYFGLFAWGWKPRKRQPSSKREYLYCAHIHRKYVILRPIHWKYSTPFRSIWPGKQKWIKKIGLFFQHKFCLP